MKKYTGEKFIKDGKIAVLYSPGFDAGWYTWNKKYPVLLFHPVLVQKVLDGKQNELTEGEEVAKLTGEAELSDCFLNGGAKLKIKWLSPGEVFHITEYDGSESIEINGNDNFIEA